MNVQELTRLKELAELRLAQLTAITQEDLHLVIKFSLRDIPAEIIPLNHRERAISEALLEATAALAAEKQEIANRVTSIIALINAAGKSNENNQ